MSVWIAILAILRESWLTLQAEKLFKLVLGLNLLVIVAYASIGFDDTGVSLFFGLSHVDSEYVHAGTPLARTLYLGIYSAFIVNLWLAWAASILALISTSSIFPSFLKEGAVELVMSRPTRRATIFFVKYIGGLLFVAVQVGIFTIGAFLAAGWRIDVWDPMIFLAIPLVTLFYSYLFCINVLAGIITRSTLTALLVTLLFWFGTFSIHMVDDVLSTRMIEFEETADRAEKRIVELKAEHKAAAAENDTAEADDAEHWMQGPQKEAETARTAIDQLAPWETVVGIIRTTMPETDRTLNLLHRELERDSEVSLVDLMAGRGFEDENEQTQEMDEYEVAGRRKMEEENEIPAWRIIGKSLIFEVIVLGLALWIFQRRDY
ncbi:MAG: ABC transporter permease subunit [Phycisphaerales bacterium]|jgi:ABC-type transport system involved in multi-copper enzyme maturation permease subunit|nr:ABC transporter permease subunit [Phycisphaerales bacterium]